MAGIRCCRHPCGSDRHHADHRQRAKPENISMANGRLRQFGALVWALYLVGARHQRCLALLDGFRRRENTLGRQHLRDGFDLRFTRHPAQESALAALFGHPRRRRVSWAVPLGRHCNDRQMELDSASSRRALAHHGAQDHPHQRGR